MTDDYSTEELKKLSPYYSAIRRKYPKLSPYEVRLSALVLQGLEEDPNNCKDYKSIAIAVNEATGV